MRLAILLAAAIGLAISSTATRAEDETLSEPHIRAVMQQAETLLHSLGIDVRGYASGALPAVAIVEPGNLMLQGNDGAYIGGRIFLNGNAVEACRDLTLLHEIVHDATVRHRLFRTVPNGEVREMIEALADEVTWTAAQSPWRPRCLPTREFSVSTAELASLALR